jgi:hypothetical protein
MSSNRFHIEIEVDDIDTPERMEAVTEAVRNGARAAFSSIMLITGGKQKPTISVWGENFEEGRSDVSLVEQEDDQ